MTLVSEVSILTQEMMSTVEIISYIWSKVFKTNEFGFWTRDSLRILNIKHLKVFQFVLLQLHLNLGTANLFVIPSLLI